MIMSGRTRVVITGMGVVAPLGGDSVKGYWEALKAGKSGIGPMTVSYTHLTLPTKA